MSRKMTNKEAISNLNHIYGIVSPDIQRSLDVAFKALEEQPRETLKNIISEEITRKYGRWDKKVTVAEFETFIRDIIDRLEAES